MNSSSQIWGIVGYRGFTNKDMFNHYMDQIVEKRNRLPSMVVSGGASGADTLAKEWAKEHNISFHEFLPVSQTREALLARNTLIAMRSNLVIAFLSKESRGTWDTIRKSRKLGKEVIIVNID